MTRAKKQTVGEDFSSDENLTSLPATAPSVPALTFKGCPLYDGSPGMALLIAQAGHSEDTNLTHWLCVIFLHLVRDASLSRAEDMKRHAIPLAWDFFEFRAQLLAWIDRIGFDSRADMKEAKTVFERLTGAASAAADRPKKRKRARR